MYFNPFFCQSKAEYISFSADRPGNCKYGNSFNNVRKPLKE